MMATAYLMLVIGVAIIVAAWDSNRVARRADDAFLKSIKAERRQSSPSDDNQT